MPDKLSIVHYPDPILRRPTVPVTEVTGELRELVSTMEETMGGARGLGLAANQVGESVRLALITGTGDAGDLRVLINPEILSEEGAVADEEGCLSFPGLLGQITRPERIRIRYRNLDWQVVEEEVEGLLARCFCHEVDHLDGILFISKMTPADRMRLKRPLRELEERAEARREGRSVAQ